MSCSICSSPTPLPICRECEMMQRVDEAFANHDWDGEDDE